MTTQHTEQSERENGVTKVERGFRWDCDKLRHVPMLTLEFEPVPMNSPNDAKGWADRDALAAALLSADAKPVQYLIEAEWPDRFGVPLEVLHVTDLGNGKVGIRVKPHESREAILCGDAKPVRDGELTAAQQRMLHDSQSLQQFHTKHALGPMMPPSCLCCGQQTHQLTRPVSVRHMELPGIVICKVCYDAALLAEDKAGREAVGWVREWDGDDSDLGNLLFTDVYEDTLDGHEWTRVYTHPQLQPEAGRVPLTEGGKTWAIDHSAGRPILVLNGCSVIEAEDAEYVLALIKRDAEAAHGIGKNQA